MNERLRQFCSSCPYKQVLGRDKCPMVNKNMCPDYSAFKASLVLEDDETAKLIPLDLLLKALRSHGYTGELRKTVSVTI